MLQNSINEQIIFASVPRENRIETMKRFSSEESVKNPVFIAFVYPSDVPEIDGKNVKQSDFIVEENEEIGGTVVNIVSIRDNPDVISLAFSMLISQVKKMKADERPNLYYITDSNVRLPYHLLSKLVDNGINKDVTIVAELLKNTYDPEDFEKKDKKKKDKKKKKKK